MVCNKCGAQIPDDAKFCNVCASEIIPDQKSETKEILPPPDDKELGDLFEIMFLALPAQLLNLFPFLVLYFIKDGISSDYIKYGLIAYLIITALSFFSCIIQNKIALTLLQITLPVQIIIQVLVTIYLFRIFDFSDCYIPLLNILIIIFTIIGLKKVNAQKKKIIEYKIKVKSAKTSRILNTQTISISSGTAAFKPATLPESNGDNPFAGNTWNAITEDSDSVDRFSFYPNGKAEHFSKYEYENTVSQIYSYSFDSSKNELYLMTVSGQLKTFSYTISNNEIELSEKPDVNEKLKNFYYAYFGQTCINWVFEDGCITVSYGAELDFAVSMAGLSQDGTFNCDVEDMNEKAAGTYSFAEDASTVTLTFTSIPQKMTGLIDLNKPYTLNYEGESFTGSL